MADTNSGQIDEEPDLVYGSLVLGLFVSVFTIVMLVRFGHVGWAWGFSAGAVLSLISLYSLGSLVPKLMMPSAPSGVSQFLLALVLFLKLPLYTVVLYLVTRLHGVNPASAFPGILVAPMAITAKTVGALLWQCVCDASDRRAIRRGGRSRIGTGYRRRAIVAEPAAEQG